MLKLVDLTFYTNKEFTDPKELIKAQRASLGYINHISKYVSVEVIKHTAIDQKLIVNNININLFKSNNSFFRFPLKTYQYINKIKPDAILVQGLIFPLQVLYLKLFIPKKTIIIAQHHGEQPFKFYVKKLIQRIADKYINTYLFTSKGNTLEWVKEKVIKDQNKIVELQEGSTPFKRQESLVSRKESEPVFLWVGRLNSNKDPVTVLKAFSKYIPDCPSAKLYMVYQTQELLEDINKLINNIPSLKESIILVGEIGQDELESWYSNADYYISGSHQESCGFALLEAMACGCIPIVTDIPTFSKITRQGKFGFLFKAGDEDSLITQLSRLPLSNKAELSDKIVSYFERELSFKKIAEELLLIFNK